MDPNLEMEFDLDDILREFSDHPQPPKPKPRPVSEVSGDTIRLDQVRKAIAEAAPATKEETTIFRPISDETAVFQPVSDETAVFQPVSDETAVFQPVSDETAVFQPVEAPSVPNAVHIHDEPEEAPPAAEVEPFSEGWEPEYEEPIGEYTAPEPIPFRPRSRLKELREKLVTGPEKRYYELSEIGLGKLQMSLLLMVCVFLICAGSTALYAWGVIPPTRIRLLIFLQFLGLLMSALLGCYRLMEGFAELLRLRFTTNTLLSFTFIVCCIDGVLCLQELRIPVSAAFSLEMTMAIWATYHRRNALMGMMDTMRRATTLDSIVRVDGWYEGRPGYLQGRGEVEHFMDHYDTPSGPDRVLDTYALTALFVSIAIGVLAGVRHGLSTGVQHCVSALLVGLPATAMLTTTRPMAILEKQLHKLGTVLCGWQGIKAVDHNAAYPLSDTDLFPHGSAKLNGVKFYGDREPDQVIAYTTSLIRQSGGALVSLFGDLLESRGGFSCPAENLNLYPGGIGGEIGEDSVLVGTLEFMRDMGVDMGSGTRVSQAVYCAIDGELSGVFAINYLNARSSAAGIRTLCGYRGLTPVALCDDFMITEGFLRSKFGINTRRMAFPGLEQRLELSEREPEADGTVVALTTREGLAPRAFAITGARVLKNAMKLGVAIHMTGGILGLLIMAALAWVNGAQILTPENILLYELVWMIPGLLITEWTRTL